MTPHSLLRNLPPHNIANSHFCLYFSCLSTVIPHLLGTTAPARSCTSNNKYSPSLLFLSQTFFLSNQFLKTAIPHVSSHFIPHQVRPFLSCLRYPSPPPHPTFHFSFVNRKSNITITFSPQSAPPLTTRRPPSLSPIPKTNLFFGIYSADSGRPP